MEVYRCVWADVRDDLRIAETVDAFRAGVGQDSIGWSDYATAENWHVEAAEILRGAARRAQKSRAEEAIADARGRE